ncbi:hypothetical protein Acsp06_62670 [Actinomycetospora sp. NBRC 106375]|nr:hypothetical protein Acsp06_62670 [Actinomycetospora sp. NBRC 106375]
MARDSKGLYKMARAHQMKGLTGIDAPYEPPLSADFVFTPSDSELLTVVNAVVGTDNDDW